MNQPTKTRRRKQPAAGAPSKLTSALRAKLGAATWKLLEVQKAEQPRVGGNESHHDLVVQFLRSARGVYPVAETFGKAWLPGDGFEELLPAFSRRWEGALT